MEERLEFTMTRFMNGHNKDIQGIVELKDYRTLELTCPMIKDNILNFLTHLLDMWKHTIVHLLHHNPNFKKRQSEKMF